MKPGRAYIIYVCIILLHTYVIYPGDHQCMDGWVEVDRCKEQEGDGWEERMGKMEIEGDRRDGQARKRPNELPSGFILGSGCYPLSL